MDPSRRVTFSCLALIALVALSGHAFAGSTTVGLCAGPGIHYTTIQAAVTAAVVGGTVEVCPGTYPEQVLINKNLTLKGIASGSTDAAVVVPPAGGLVSNGSDIFDNPVAAQIFVQGSSPESASKVSVSSGITVTVSDLTVDGTGNNIATCGPPTLEGIYFQNASGKITGNVVRNQFMTDFADYGGCQNALAINVESLTPGNTVTISGNSVHAYQKNGITATGAATGAGSPGPNVTISANYIVGLAATAMNWPGGAGENGIQIGFGASGTVSGNTVNDNIWGGENTPPPITPGNGASGILVYASEGIKVTDNSVGSAQFGISTNTDPTYGPGDNTTITGNKVSGTQLFDAIDVCSNSNTVKSNTIYGSAQSGVHVDDSCGSGNSNTVTNNIINEACAGVLLGTGTGTTFSPNTYLNVVNTTLGGDVCAAVVVAAAEARGAVAKHSFLRPSPYKPSRN